MLSKSALLVGAMCASVAKIAASASAQAIYPHVPLVFWSNQAIFNNRDAYLNSVFNKDEVTSVIKNAVTRDTDKDIYNVLNHQPVGLTRSEVLCVFVAQNLQTDHLAQFGKDSYVEKAVKTSKSSVVVPHTTRTASLLDALEGLHPAVISISEVEGWITSDEGKKLLKNGETDLLVVRILNTSKPSEVDSQIEAAARLLSAATADLADFALTGAETDRVLLDEPHGRRRLASTTGIICDVGYLIGTSASGKAFCFSHYVHMTPEILTALIFGFFFLFLAYVGISVLHAIQTPLHYPHQGPPKGKEF